MAIAEALGRALAAEGSGAEVVAASQAAGEISGQMGESFGVITDKVTQMSNAVSRLGDQFDILTRNVTSYKELPVVGAIGSLLDAVNPALGSMYKMAFAPLEAFNKIQQAMIDLRKSSIQTGAAFGLSSREIKSYANSQLAVLGDLQRSLNVSKDEFDQYQKFLSRSAFRLSDLQTPIQAWGQKATALKYLFGISKGLNIELETVLKDAEEGALKMGASTQSMRQSLEDVAKVYRNIHRLSLELGNVSAPYIRKELFNAISGQSMAITNFGAKMDALTKTFKAFFVGLGPGQQGLAGEFLAKINRGFMNLSLGMAAWLGSGDTRAGSVGSPAEALDYQMRFREGGDLMDGVHTLGIKLKDLAGLDTDSWDHMRLQMKTGGDASALGHFMQKSMIMDMFKLGTNEAEKFMGLMWKMNQRGFDPNSEAGKASVKEMQDIIDKGGKVAELQLNTLERIQNQVRGMALKYIYGDTAAYKQVNKALGTPEEQVQRINSALLKKAQDEKWEDARKKLEEDGKKKKDEQLTEREKQGLLLTAEEQQKTLGTVEEQYARAEQIKNAMVEEGLTGYHKDKSNEFLRQDQAYRATHKGDGLGGGIPEDRAFNFNPKAEALSAFRGRYEGYQKMMGGTRAMIAAINREQLERGVGGEQGIETAQDIAAAVRPGGVFNQSGIIRGSELGTWLQAQAGEDRPISSMQVGVTQVGKLPEESMLRPRDVVAIGNRGADITNTSWYMDATESGIVDVDEKGKLYMTYSGQRMSMNDFMDRFSDRPLAAYRLPYTQTEEYKRSMGVQKTEAQETGADVDREGENKEKGFLGNMWDKFTDLWRSRPGKAVGSNWMQTGVELVHQGEDVTYGQLADMIRLVGGPMGLIAGSTPGQKPQLSSASAPTSLHSKVVQKMSEAAKSSQYMQGVVEYLTKAFPGQMTGGVNNIEIANSHRQFIELIRRMNAGASDADDRLRGTNRIVQDIISNVDILRAIADTMETRRVMPGRTHTDEKIFSMNDVIATILALQPMLRQTRQYQPVASQLPKSDVPGMPPNYLLTDVMASGAASRQEQRAPAGIRPQPPMALRAPLSSLPHNIVADMDVKPLQFADAITPAKSAGKDAQPQQLNVNTQSSVTLETANIRLNTNDAISLNFPDQMSGSHQLYSMGYA